MLNLLAGWGWGWGWWDLQNSTICDAIPTHNAWHKTTHNTISTTIHNAIHTTIHNVIHTTIPVMQVTILCKSRFIVPNTLIAIFWI